MAAKPKAKNGRSSAPPTAKMGQSTRKGGASTAKRTAPKTTAAKRRPEQKDTNKKTARGKANATAKGTEESASSSSPRPVWRGHIAFGLVQLPIVLHSGERRADLQFHLVDARNTARVRYERVNEETGEEVPWDQIVKGFEFSDGHYVLLNEEEYEHASPELTRTIEIEQFVDPSEIDIRYYDRPYIIVPQKGGEKAYLMLRQALEETGKAGLAQVVIRARQYLSIVVPFGSLLVLMLLRFEQELRDLREYALPEESVQANRPNPRELGLARRLVEDMTAPWQPAKFHDEYRETLLALIDRKIKAGQTDVVVPAEPPEEEKAQPPGNVVDFIEVLKKSLERKRVGAGGPAPDDVAPEGGHTTRKKRSAG